MKAIQYLIQEMTRKNAQSDRIMASIQKLPNNIAAPKLCAEMEVQMPTNLATMLAQQK
jgi:hypothetical protein